MEETPSTYLLNNVSAAHAWLATEVGRALDEAFDELVKLRPGLSRSDAIRKVAYPWVELINGPATRD